MKFILFNDTSNYFFFNAAMYISYTKKTIRTKTYKKSDQSSLVLAADVVGAVDGDPKAATLL